MRTTTELQQHCRAVRLLRGALIAGFTLIGLAGDQRTRLGGVGFVVVLSSILVLSITFLASVLAVMVVTTLDRHDQGNRGQPAVLPKTT
jgi:hypothetical protein